MATNKHMTALTIQEIPVYPNFAKFKAKYRFGDTPYVCEDDNGCIAYISEEAKKKFIEWTKRSPYGSRRRKNA